MTYRLLADAVLLLHFGIVLFVVAGLGAIVIGGLRGWRLARSLRFRIAHLAAIAFVVVQAWLGAVCPLTTLERWLRAQASDRTYGGSFIEHWVQRILFYQAPSWMFTLAYSLFGLAVLAAWWYFPPQRKHK
jgi:polyferredoxin